MKFSTKIVKWYNTNKRNLPWRVTNDPYKIWLSEIILQQTRIDQGTSYYLKFVASYPDVNSLAAADEIEILKLWQGLGYYSRARNLHKAAKIIATDYNGVFPKNYEDIISLPGIGGYTAAAISSMAFNQAYAVVDGNVNRLIARIFGVVIPVNSGAGKKEIAYIAQSLITKHDPGTYNQAVMEFGALFCKPQNPDCNNCIFRKECYAHRNKLVDKLPVKEKTIKQRKRYFHYMVFKIKKENKIYTFINRRSQNDIWQNMYDFPLLEKSKKTAKAEIVSELKKEFSSDVVLNPGITKEFKHILSHQLIYARFYVSEILISNQTNNIIEKFQEKYLLIPLESFNDYPVPRLIEKVINETQIL